jgi:hypothetical protein
VKNEPLWNNWRMKVWDLELVRWTISEVEVRLRELVDASTLVGLLLYLREHG